MMGAWLWIAVPGVPLLLAALVLVRSTQTVAMKLVPWAAVPAVALLASTEMGARVEFDALLLGTTFALDEVAWGFLALTTLLWTAAGAYAGAYLADDPARHRYFLFHLLTMSGNLGLTLAADVVGFYLFFALMTFSAYGLVIHVSTPAARRAGRIYIALAVFGEALLLAGILLAVDATGGIEFRDMGRIADPARQNLVIALGLAGFGVKAGAFPLHVWLPLAHPVAPTPASAVLSGAMIKAGLLGWLRFLPIGVAAFPGWMTFVVAAGVFSALLGAVLGALQDDPKTVLAYSSISQMGWMTVGVGVALGAPEHTMAATAAVTLFAAHHGIAKASLFLGVGVARAAPQSGTVRALVRAGLTLAALTLAGAPFTSGALVKSRLKQAGAAAPWPEWSEAALLFAAVGTGVVMIRFLALVWNGHAPEHRLAARLWVPWTLLVLLSAGLPLGAGVMIRGTGAPDPASLAAVLSGLWPLAIAAGLAWIAWRTPVGRRLPRPPAGDLLELLAPPISRAIAQGRDLAVRLEARAAAAGGGLAQAARVAWRRAPLSQAEDALEPWLAIGAVFLLIAALLFLRLTVL